MEEGVFIDGRYHRSEEVERVSLVLRIATKQSFDGFIIKAGGGEGKMGVSYEWGLLRLIDK